MFLNFMVGGLATKIKNKKNQNLSTGLLWGLRESFNNVAIWKELWMSAISAESWQMIWGDERHFKIWIPQSNKCSLPPHYSLFFLKNANPIPAQYLLSNVLF